MKHQPSPRTFTLFSISLLATTCLLLAGLFLPDLVLAQDPPPPAFGPQPGQVPVDGGLALLAAGGAGYAIKKMRDRKRHKDSFRSN